MIVYYEDSILSYIASIRSYFGLNSSYKQNTKFSDYINYINPRKIVLFLVDGLGANFVWKKLDDQDFLKDHMKFKTSTVFPSATTAATTSIRTGKSPCENAWIGWSQYFKEYNDQIICFRNKGFYSEKIYDEDVGHKLLPVQYIEDELNDKGIKAKTVFPSFIKGGSEDINGICNQTLAAVNKDECRFVYAYWDKYDSYMHEHGPNSKICDAYLKHINYELENLSNKLPDDTLLVVTGDHGQVEVHEEINLCGSKYEKYFRLKPCLEPRAYTFYIKEGMAQDFEVEFKNEFEDKFILLSHEQVLDTKLFGDRDLHPKFEEYIGEYLAIAKTNSIFAYKENYVEPFKGQHGGMMDDEMMIPIIVNKKIPL